MSYTTLLAMHRLQAKRPAMFYKTDDQSFLSQKIISALQKRRLFDNEESKDDDRANQKISASISRSGFLVHILFSLLIHHNGVNDIHYTTTPSQIFFALQSSFFLFFVSKKAPP